MMRKGLFRNLLVAGLISVGLCMAPTCVMADETYTDVTEEDLVQIYMNQGFSEETARRFAAYSFSDGVQCYHTVTVTDGGTIYFSVSGYDGGAGDSAIEATTSGETLSYEDYLRQAAAENGATYCATYEDAVNLINQTAAGYCWESEDTIMIVTNDEVGDQLWDAYCHKACDKTFASYKAVFRSTITRSSSNGYYTLLTFKLSSAQEGYNAEMTQDMYYAALNKVAELGPQLRGNSTAETVTNVYYYLLNHCDYDYSYAYGDPYHVLYDGTGVCMGYATAFQMFMDYYGIECYIDLSSDHGWNAVRVDGGLYWVDATWGDSAGQESKWLLVGTDKRADAHGLGVSATAYNGYKGGDSGNSSQAGGNQQSTQATEAASAEKTTQAAETVSTEQTTQETEYETEKETESEEETTEEAMKENDSKDSEKDSEETEQSFGFHLADSVIVASLGESEAQSNDKTDRKAGNLTSGTASMVTVAVWIMAGGTAALLAGGVVTVIVLGARKKQK